MFESDRARLLLRSGVTLAGSLHGPARLAVAGFTAGGLATLDAFAAADYDVVAAVARPGRVQVVRNLAGVLARARTSSRTGAPHAVAA